MFLIMAGCTEDGLHTCIGEYTFDRVLHVRTSDGVLNCLPVDALPVRRAVFGRRSTSDNGRHDMCHEVYLRQVPVGLLPKVD